MYLLVPDHIVLSRKCLPTLRACEWLQPAVTVQMALEIDIAGEMSFANMTGESGFLNLALIE